MTLIHKWLTNKLTKSLSPQGAKFISHINMIDQSVTICTLIRMRMEFLTHTYQSQSTLSLFRCYLRLMVFLCHWWPAEKYA